MSEKMRSYEAARGMFSFWSFLAWGLIVVGAVAALLGFQAAAEISRFSRGSGLEAVLGFVPGFVLMLSGFFWLAFVQIARASVDTAEYTQQMLKVARDQLEVSRQGLNGAGQPAESFAQHPRADADKANGYSTPSSYETDAVSQTSTDAMGLDAIFANGSDRGQYKGVELRKKGKLLLVENKSFLTLERAKQFIDENQI